jgi:hypothetical protein
MERFVKGWYIKGLKKCEGNVIQKHLKGFLQFW